MGTWQGMDMPFDPAELPTGQLMQISPLVGRVLAPNPSPYTWTGTQSYIVGHGDVAVIDPGPDDPAHIDALMAAIAGRPVLAIMATHTHRDHSPGTRPLAVATGAPIIGCAPLFMDDSGPRADAAFDRDYGPDRVMQDGEALAGEGWTLRAIATPGHISNHLCYALEEEKALFSGDHVMGWSTSVVAPPDGNMGDYMRSLDLLMGRDDSIYYPAHGDPITDPRRLVRGMMGHRKQREGQILRFIGANGAAPIPAMVAAMYKGLDPRLHRAAGQSVLAHLIDLADRDIVAEGQDGWRLIAAVQ